MPNPKRVPRASTGRADDVPVPPARVRVTGRLAIRPGLDDAELAYLTAFCESRRWERSGGPYAVPPNPLAECVSVAVDVEAFSRPAAGQPSLTCAWLPDEAGTALVPRAVVDSADEVDAWLAYLRTHFLGSPAPTVSATSAVPRFGAHTLTGAVAIADGSSGALDALVLEGGALRRVRLHPTADRRIA